MSPPTAPTNLTTAGAGVTTPGTRRCDVLVIGSGGAGLTAALSARRSGLEVLVVEKADTIGGTTAISGGSLWVPANSVSARAGIADSVDAGRRYLKQHMGSRYAGAAEAFLAEAPKMIDFLERETAVRFYCQDDFPDFRPQLDGALQGGGRTICAEPFDARPLQGHVRQLPAPLYTQTALGMMTTPRDLAHFRYFTRSWRSLRYVARRFFQHRRDMLLYGRTMWLTNGNALVARLLHSMVDQEVPIWLSASAVALIESEGWVRGARVATPQGEVHVRADCGVVLACGGFGHDAERCSEWLPRPSLDGQDWSMASPGHTGDALRLGQAVGARIAEPGFNAALWAPVSRVPALGGMLHGHYCDRSKPPVIAVTPSGARFTDESESYHHFCEALLRATPYGEPAQAYLITDQSGIDRYGLGAVLAKPFPTGRHLASGYLMRGKTLADLAARAGIAPDELVRSVAAFNHGAAAGEDGGFGKGSNTFDRHYGDSANQPNPCLAPISTAPFYAMRITVGHMGTMLGLDTDEFGRVRGSRGRPITGLYAVGEAAASPFAGSCPSAGAMLSAGMTAGYVAGRHLAQARTGQRPAESAESVAPVASAAPIPNLAAAA